MFNTKKKIHDYILPLILCAAGTTGCVSQDAPVVIVQPSATPSGTTGYTPYVPPSTGPVAPPASAPAATNTAGTPATAGKLAQDPASSSSAGVLIPVTGKTVYQVQAAPGEPTQYIVVDAVRPPVASE